MTKTPENLKENDFYLAKSGEKKWFNLIVRVVGEQPFLTLEAWDMCSDRLSKIRYFEIQEWGKKICSSEDL